MTLQGYNTWYSVFMNPTEANCLEQLGLLKSNGLFSAGYNYFNLCFRVVYCYLNILRDDGVFVSRNVTDGNRFIYFFSLNIILAYVSLRLVVSSTQFPSGFRDLVQKVLRFFLVAVDFQL